MFSFPLSKCICLLLLFGLMGPVVGLSLLSPCPHVFSYQRVPGTNHVFGYVILQNIRVAPLIKVKIEMSIGTAVIKNNVGSITLIKSKEQTFHDINKNQSAQYRVNFPSYSLLPKVLAININEQTICTSRKINVPNENTFYLEHRFITQMQPIQTPQLIQTQRPAVHSSSTESELFNLDCGKPSSVFNRLSMNGIRSPKGQFPWAAPIFEATSSKPKYICSSTIITERHLVTAAHCMYTSNGIERSANELTTVPGMYNIDNFLDGDLQWRNVKKIFIHEDYYFEDTVLLDSDIAVMLVDEPLEFNDLVKPICLWSESDNLEQIVGVKGFVSGWGVTEYGDAKYPSYVTATVVDRRTCSRNLDKLIAANARLLCGDGHGAVPCTGDNGSGLVIKRGQKYYIRGIVSVGQFDPNTLTCATDKYVVYTDVAPFRYWLSRVVQHVQNPQLIQTQRPAIHSSSTESELFNLDCGKPSSVFNRLSMNGIRSPKGQFPWAAPIFEATSSKPKYICSSTIITERHLVTAAHCMYTSNGIERSANELTTVPGMYNIDNFLDGDLQWRNVKKIFIHEDYYFEDTVLLDSDIAVMLVDEPLEFNDLVKPICLWSESDNLEQIVGVKGFVSGWGVTEYGDAKYPSYVTATVVDRRTCSRNLDKLIAANARLLCGDGHGAVPCTGDNGSGLVIKRGQKYYIRGIVSVGQFDPNTLTCATDKYVVYTDVAPFRYWLSRVVQHVQNPQLIQTQRPAIHSSSTESELFNLDCGKPSSVFNRLSLNGIRSPKGQFPWAAPIFEATSSKPKYICSSTIITERHLVTAAHCMYTSNGIERSANELTTVPGMYNIDNFLDGDLQWRNVKKIFIHEDYYFEDTVLLDSDIAVMLVDEPLEFNDLVKPICLWSESDNLEQIVGVKGFVSGWGVTEYGDAKYPSYVTATVVDRRTCSRNLDKLIAANARLLCGDGHGAVPCTGDNGSGLVIKRGQKYYIRGIVSVGQFDPNTLICATDKYVVYTDVAPFRYWLSRVVMVT